MARDATQEADPFLAAADAQIGAHGDDFLAAADKALNRDDKEKRPFVRAVGATAAALGEGIIGQQPGRLSAAGRIAASQVEGANYGGYGAMPGTIRYALPNVTFLGKTPTFKDMEKLSEKDSEFRDQWEELKRRRDAALDLQLRIHGKNPNWNAIQGQYVTALAEGAIASGAVDPNAPREKWKKPEMTPERAPRLKSGIEPVIEIMDGSLRGSLGRVREKVEAISFEMTPFDEALNRFSKEARNGTPGLVTPPPTDEQLAQLAWEMLQAQGAEEQKRLPAGVAPVTRGVGGAASVLGGMWAGSVISKGLTKVGGKLVEKGLGRVGGALTKAGTAGAPYIEGAAISALQQGLGIAGGSLKELSVGEIIRDAGLLKLGTKAAEVIAARFPNAPAVVSSLGTVGTMEAGGAASRFLESGKTPFDGGLKGASESLLETAATIATTAIFGGSPSGKKSAEKGAGTRPTSPVDTLLDLAAKPQEGAGGRKVPAGEVPIQDTPAYHIRAAQVGAETLKAKLRNLLGISGDPVKDAAYKAKVTDEVLPLEVKALQDEIAISEFLDYRFEKGSERRARLANAAYVNLQMHGKPGTVKDPSLNMKEVAELSELMKTAGKSYQELGERLMIEERIPEAIYQEIVPKRHDRKPREWFISKREFDQGFTDPKTVKDKETGELVNYPSVKVNREQAAAGRIGQHRVKLAGGIQASRDAGFFMPIIGVEDTFRAQAQQLGDLPKGAKFKSPKRATEKDSEGQQHLKRRTETFEEVLAKRALDTSIGSAARVFKSEAKILRDELYLKFAREGGDVKTVSELPNAAERQQATRDAITLTDGLRQIDFEQRQAKDPLKKMELADRRVQLEVQLNRLKAIAKDDYFKEAKGKEWGRWEGTYMAPWVMRSAKAMRDEGGPVTLLGEALMTATKRAKIGQNLSLITQDTLGNLVTADTIGVPVNLSELARSYQKVNGKKKKATVDLEFDALAHGSALGGPTEISGANTRLLERINDKIKDYRESGDPTWVLKAAQLIERRGELIDAFERVTSKLPGGLPDVGAAVAGAARLPGKLADLRVSLDRSVAHAIYTKLRESGVDGSGPLSPGSAWTIVQKAMDYGTLPKGVQQAARAWFSTLRFPSKVVHGTISALVRRPTLFGKPVDTPLDRFITENPGSTAANAALVSRGLVRLASVAAKWSAIPIALAATMRSQVGVTQAQVDKYVDDTYDYLPAAVRATMKPMFIPLKKTATGGIQGIDAASLFPAIAAMRYFHINFNDTNLPTGASMAWQLVNKNMLAGPVAQIGARRAVSGKNRAEGFGPRERWWPAIEMFAPQAIMGPLNAYFDAENVPVEERNAMLAMMRSATGLPLSVIRSKDFRMAYLDRMYQDGVVERTDEASGASYYKVADPNSFQGMLAQDFINDLEKNPDTYRMLMKRDREIRKASGD